MQIASVDRVLMLVPERGPVDCVSFAIDCVHLTEIRGLD